MRLGSVAIKGMFLTLIPSNLAQTQPLDRFKQKFYEKLQVNVFLCTSKPKFDNAVSETYRIQITNFRVNCLVLIYRHLGLGIVAEP